MNPPTPPPPAAQAPRGSRLPLIIAAAVFLACIGLICAAAIGALLISRFAPSSAPTSTPPASLIIATTRATPTTAALPTLAPCPTPTSTPTQTPVPINAQPGQPTSSAPAPPPAAPVQTSEPCEPLAPEPTTVAVATAAAPTSTPTAPAGRTPLPTIAFSGSCLRPTAAALSPSPYITSITMAQDVQGDAKDPVNPTRQFSANSVFHAVVAIEDAPDNTKFKAVWYATDVGSAAPCNTPIDSFELASDGTRNLDFNLTPSSRWPPGLFRVEIYVNSTPDSIVDFTVR